MAYALDVTGHAIENLVLGNTVNIIPTPGTYLRIVPVVGPFFAEGCIIRHTSLSGSYRTLELGVDYTLGYLFQDASIKCNSLVYGCIVLNDANLTGTITYSLQALGGTYSLTTIQVSTVLSAETRDPAVTSWEQVCTSRQITLATMPNVDYAYTRATSAQFRGLTDVLNKAGLAIHLRPKFLPNPGNAAFIPTAAELGLGNVDNFQTATNADVVAGIATDKFVTPAGVAASVSAKVTEQLSILGFSAPITYQGSLVVNNTSQTYLYDGDIWAAKEGTVPFTTSSLFDSTKFVLVTSNSRDVWQNFMYTVTGNEAKTVLNELIIPLGVTIKSKIRSRLVINDICECTADIDYRLDGNNLILNYTVVATDVILFRYKQMKSRVADMPGYCKSFSITNATAPITLVGSTGIAPDDLQVRLNDFIILNPLRGDYVISNGVLTISYPMNIGDIVEVQDLDSTPDVGVQALRSVLYVV